MNKAQEKVKADVFPMNYFFSVKEKRIEYREVVQEAKRVCILVNRVILAIAFPDCNMFWSYSSPFIFWQFIDINVISLLFMTKKPCLKQKYF